MRKTGCLTAAALIAVAIPANAGSVAAAIAGFGLIGTWSSNCAGGVGIGRPGFRLVFAAGPGGVPTRRTISSDGAVTTTVQTKVVAAVRLAADRLQLTLRIIGGDRNGGPLPDTMTNTFDQVVEKIGGNRIRLPGAEPELLYRCHG